VPRCACCRRTRCSPRTTDRSAADDFRNDLSLDTLDFTAPAATSRTTSSNRPLARHRPPPAAHAAGGSAWWVRRPREPTRDGVGRDPNERGDRAREQHERRNPTWRRIPASWAAIVADGPAAPPRARVSGCRVPDRCEKVSTGGSPPGFAREGPGLPPNSALRGRATCTDPCAKDSSGRLFRRCVTGIACP